MNSDELEKFKQQLVAVEERLHLTLQVRYPNDPHTTFDYWSYDDDTEQFNVFWEWNGRMGAHDSGCYTVPAYLMLQESDKGFMDAYRRLHEAEKAEEEARKEASLAEIKAKEEAAEKAKLNELLTKYGLPEVY